MDMYTELAAAPQRQQLSLVYQPRVDLTRGRIAGVESLLRWHHPALGNVSPGCFIPLAEERGLISELGDWVLTEAMRQAGVWKQEGRNLVVAINLSPQQLNANLPERVNQLLHAHGLQGSDVELELTETADLKAHTRNARILEHLQDVGVQLALDDFGSGYSSLARLQELSFDVLKLDKCLIDGLLNSEKSRVIVSSTLLLAQTLGLRTVAEGIEHAEQLALLHRYRCHEVQGYLLAKPLAVDRVNQLLTHNNFSSICKQTSWQRVSPQGLLSTSRSSTRPHSTTPIPRPAYT